MNKVHDFRSDTVTKPTDAMRKAMFSTPVGDDVFEDDEVTKELERLSAEITGKEAALFLPSGTMANQTAINVIAPRGSEIILSESCHIIQHEVGAAAGISGVQTRTLKSRYGLIDLNEIEHAIRTEDIHFPTTSMVCLESPHNDDGGVVLPLNYMTDVRDLAKKRGLSVYLDGARIFNAAIFLDKSVADIAKNCDALMFCLSKSLCAPAGSMLCGSSEFIKKAKKTRKMLGGGMRQTGILACCGIIAIKEMSKRLKDDHDRARKFADFLRSFKKITVDENTVQTNMVYFFIKNNTDLIDFLGKRSILIIDHGTDRIRVTFHNDIKIVDMNALEKGISDYFKK